MEGIWFIAIGVYLSLVGFRNIKSSRNNDKNKEWLDKYGTFMKIGGPSLIVIGLLRLFVFK